MQVNTFALTKPFRRGHILGAYWRGRVIPCAAPLNMHPIMAREGRTRRKVWNQTARALRCGLFHEVLAEYSLCIVYSVLLYTAEHPSVPCWSGWIYHVPAGPGSPCDFIGRPHHPAFSLSALTGTWDLVEVSSKTSAVSPPPVDLFGVHFYFLLAENFADLASKSAPSQCFHECLHRHLHLHLHHHLCHFASLDPVRTVAHLGDCPKGSHPIACQALPTAHKDQIWLEQTTDSTMERTESTRFEAAECASVWGADKVVRQFFSVWMRPLIAPSATHSDWA